jgi:hypothetical protein
MRQTYKAILRGNYLEWSGDAPENLEEDRAIEVHVTVLKEAPISSGITTQGESMVEALEKLAALNALSGISDPSMWQREQRQDRSLPDRDA